MNYCSIWEGNFLLISMFMLQSMLQSDATTSWSRHQKYEGSSGVFQLIQRCIKAGAMTSWSRHQKLQGEFWWFQLLFILQSGTMRSWSWHQKYEREFFYEFMSISWFLSLFSSLLLNWPMVEIYSVLCTSHCVVFYNVPPLMGQVLGKVLLTSWEIN